MSKHWIWHYFFQFGECDTSKSLNEGGTEHIPIVLTEVQHFVLECRGFGHIECGLRISVRGKK